MKTAPVIAALARRPREFEQILVHTGQHYDYDMSRIFIEELNLGDPDYMLEVGSGSHAQQTARVLERLEPVLLETAPDVVLVPGDVNSTMAAAIAAAKLGIPIGHIEAGLRSFDRTMPEELNRVVADALSELLFIHSPEARDNLLAEGLSGDGIHYVGNTMIDTLVAMRDQIDAVDAPGRYGLNRGRYLAVTLHRPALVDGPMLGETLRQLNAISAELEVVFPIHPRTRASMEAGAIEVGSPRMQLLEPLGYLDFLGLVAGAAGVLTDSGGIQEETTFLGIPCFTLRANTERPITIELGTNTLLGLDPERIADIPRLIDVAKDRPTQMPPLWDGKAGERIADVLSGAEIPLEAVPGVL
jgi:UDP-N-acetylglucosamine 2-epimerase (non-hydrolysing)